MSVPKPAGTHARVIADSISPEGVRLTTMEVTYHRFVLAEFNTHRVFSRNSESSRAVPFPKKVQRVTENPASPVVWASEQKGMQGGEEIPGAAQAQDLWLEARTAAVAYATALAELGVHKSICNRLLEPFMWHTVIVTATEWDGFWRQRCSPLAQPEIMVAAELMRVEYFKSRPTPLDYGQWHTPYIDPERDTWIETDGLTTEEMWDVVKKVSVARCARVSYLTHDGTRDHEQDLQMYERLISADPPHASPLEHVATPCRGHVRDIKTRREAPHLGNLRGWDQMRHQVLDF